MRKLLFAALAALAITTSVGSAFAAEVGDGTTANFNRGWNQGQPQSFIYSSPNG